MAEAGRLSVDVEVNVETREQRRRREAMLGWCSQCGQTLDYSACGPTHALRAWRRENADEIANRLQEVEAPDENLTP